MTADPTPAADPRLAELTEALRHLPEPFVAAIHDHYEHDRLHEADPRDFAAAILALLPARTATTEAEDPNAERCGVVEYSKRVGGYLHCRVSGPHVIHDFAAESATTEAVALAAYDENAAALLDALPSFLDDVRAFMDSPDPKRSPGSMAHRRRRLTVSLVWMGKRAAALAATGGEDWTEPQSLLPADGGKA